MSRSQGTLSADLPATVDASIGLLPGDSVAATTGATTLTRIASGEISLRATAAATAYVIVGMAGGMIYRTGVQDDLQEFFGSARAGGAQGKSVGAITTLSTASTVAGAPINIAVLSSVNFGVGQYVTIDTVASGVQEFAQITAIPDATHITVNLLVNAHTTPFSIAQNLFTTPAGVTGRPPFSGMSQLTPVTVPRTKGLKFKQLNVVYIVNTAVATAMTVGMTAISYVNGVAPVATTLIPNAANGLATAFAATPYVIPVPVPTANQGYIITPNTAVVVEFDFTTGAGATVDVLGFWLIGDANYN
jgi:hypothetical protein